MNWNEHPPYPLDSSFRWNDEDDPPVIPGEQHETRNPGGEAWMPAFAGMTYSDAHTVSAQSPSA